MVNCQNIFPPYQSVRFIEVRNWKLSLTFYILQLGVLAYIVVYSIILQKGYQEYDTLLGTSNIKVKGVGNATMNGAETVFDVYDLVQPAIEKEAIFVTSSVYATFNQQRGICPGTDLATEGCPCTKGEYTLNGLNTGICSTVGGTYCNISAWCPPEAAKTTGVPIFNVENWTVYAKYYVNFPRFQVVRSTATVNEAGVAVPTPGINLWTVAEFVHGAGFSFDSVRNTGCVIVQQAKYDCDLNRGSDNCNPDFSYIRLDLDGSQGFNYRFAVKLPSPNVMNEQRTLYKVYGTRVLFGVSGRAGRFSIIPLLLAIGSGIGLLSISNLICDVVMQKFLPDHERYVAEKFHHVPESGIPTMNPNDILEVNTLANSGALNSEQVYQRYEFKESIHLKDRETEYNYK